MAAKKNTSIVHLTSEHPRVFILQALIFAVVVMTASFAVFAYLNRGESARLAKNQALIQSLQQQSVEPDKTVGVDETMFEPTPDPSIDPQKLKDLFPPIK